MTLRQLRGRLCTQLFNLTQDKNKKVLLRERKRHAARRVSSAPYAVLSWGIPHPGYPHPDLAKGYPIPGWGYPILGTPVLTWAEGTPPWVTPIQEWNTSQEGNWDQSLGYPLPQKGPGTSHWGTHLGKDMGPVKVLWDGDGVPPPG